MASLYQPSSTARGATQYGKFSWPKCSSNVWYFCRIYFSFLKLTATLLMYQFQGLKQFLLFVCFRNYSFEIVNTYFVYSFQTWRIVTKTFTYCGLIFEPFCLDQVFWNESELELIRPSSVYQETIDHKSQIEKDFLTIKRVNTFYHYLLLNVQVVTQYIIVRNFRLLCLQHQVSAICWK